MATDVVTIWNQALSAVGSRATVATTSESSREANACNLWYTTVRDNVLKSASWPCAKVYASLTLLATRNFNDDWDDADPAPTWKYSYSEPTGMLAPRYLTSYARFERAFDVSEDAVTIVTNQEDAILHYIFQQTDVLHWDAGLEQAMIYALASHLCMPLNGKITRAKELAASAFEQVLEARTDFANESDDNHEVMPSWIGARGYSELPAGTRYVYPYEDLLGIAS